MNLTAAILIAVLIAAAVFAAIVALAARLNPPQRGRHVPFADPADRTDPHGEGFIRDITADDNPIPGLDGLTPGPVGTGWLEAVPDDDPADITGVQPADVRYLGMPSGQYVDELFGKHAEATQ